MHITLLDFLRHNEKKRGKQMNNRDGEKKKKKKKHARTRPASLEIYERSTWRNICSIWAIRTGI